MEAAAGVPDPSNVQGNVAGFNKDHQRFLFLRFTDKPTAQAFIAAIADSVASCAEVLAFNALFKMVHERRPGPARGTVEASWLNLAFTNSGLALLEAEGLDGFPEDFKQGMKARAEALGDLGANDPGQWVAPFAEEINAIALLAADDPDDLNEEYESLKVHLGEHGVTEMAAPIDGNTRPEAMAGHEHFGFKDGVSQPGIDGLTTSSHTGTDQIAAGEFICGYGGEAEPAPAHPQIGYEPAPAPLPQGLPAWSKDGSFLVFRRLQQNVKGFREAIAEEAGKAGISEQLLGAKFVGRYASGAPLERTPDEAADLDPEAADPSEADQGFLSDEKINNFDYDQDPDGQLVPRGAHIRKVNPRSGNPCGMADSNAHRILRRGIVYGTEFIDTENSYPEVGAVPADQDRGLLFLCYQSSITRGFEFIQTQWVNQLDFPSSGDGEDPIIAQKEEPRSFTLPRKTEPLHLTLKQWVKTTGGEYFFSPSVSALKQLAGQG